ncbi:hypothetical protein FPOAC2_04444 [Fusarium poae]|uniref:hypothetical protein n=1 Tax=Fusarium poae TaxID=36050 RepID=UPI001CE80881|nr:hypothetical protein FPOAC1_004360 [Fusarium poae]KAG8671121.1 hypothetical protein FPOAC1_004360 [Fusarium poae]
MFNMLLVMVKMLLVIVGGCVSTRVVANTTFPVRDDQAGTAFRYLKFALVTFSLYTLFHTVHNASNIVGSYLFRDGGNIVESAYYPVFRVLRFCSGISIGISQRCELYMDIFIGIILLRLITAILTVRFRSTGPAVKSIQFASYIISFGLVAPALVKLALDFVIIREMYPDGESEIPFSLFNAAFHHVFMQVLFIMSVPVVAGAVMVKIQTSDDKSLTWASTMLVAASVIWLTHTFMQAFGIWYFNGHAVFDYLDVAFGIWSQILVLILVYAMWLDRANGTWSKQNYLTQAQKIQ